MVLLVGGVAFVLAGLALRHLRRPLRANRRTIVLVATAVSVVANSLGPHPLGVRMLDAALAALLAAVVPLGAASVAYGWVAAGAAVAGVGATLLGGFPAALAAGIGAAAAPVLVGARNRPVQAVAGALLWSGLLRIDGEPLPSALLGAVVVALLCLPAIQRLGRRDRQRVAVVAGVAGALVLLGVTSAYVAVQGAQDDLDRGTALAAEGIASLGDDDVIAAALLREAAVAFDRAETGLDAWWTLPGRLVPVVNQHLRATTTTAGVGRDLADTASLRVAELDLEALSVVDGVVDLDAVAAITAPAAEVADQLIEAADDLEGVASPWLHDTVDDPLTEVTDRVVEARDAATEVRDVLAVLPDILGADGPRRYLLLLQQPAEARGSGGLPGNFGEIVADEGRLDLVRTGRLDDLIAAQPASGFELDVRPDIEALYVTGDPFRWQNTTTPPDFRDTAEIVAQLYPQSGGEPVDGVLSVDPIALARLLELTGPVQLPRSGVRLSSRNAEELFLHDQYVEFDERDERGERIDLLDETVDAVWDALTRGSLPGPATVVDTLAGAAAGRHVHFASFDEDHQSVLGASGLDGAVPEPVADGVGAVVQNASLNKIDWYIDRDSRYEARWDPDSGGVTGTYSLRLTNRAPTTGEPDSVIRWGGPVPSSRETAPGEYAALVYLYTALPPAAVRVDGEAIEATVRRDGAWHVMAVDVRVHSGEVGRLDVDVAGELPGDSYRLDVLRQASINGDDFSVVVHSDGAPIAGDDGSRRLAVDAVGMDGRLDQPFDLVIERDD